jgi:hypothetical protein
MLADHRRPRTMRHVCVCSAQKLVEIGVGDDGYLVEMVMVILRMP